MRERPNRTVSKTVVPPGTVGSNPTPSARHSWLFRHLSKQGRSWTHSSAPLLWRYFTGAMASVTVAWWWPPFSSTQTIGTAA
jgi:hypothetical protein